MSAALPLCPICSQPAVFWRQAPDHHYENPGVWEIYHCTRCRHLFQYPIPQEEDLLQFYPRWYYAHQPPNTDFTPRGLRHRRAWLRSHYLKYCRAYQHLQCGAYPLLAFLDYGLQRKPLHFGVPRFQQGGRLLDYGSGAGHTVAFMQYLGWQAEGIEINAAAAQVGKDAGLSIHHGSIETLEDRSDCYDHIMSSHCVEHVPDVWRLFRAFFAALKPGGVLAIEVPNAQAVAMERYQEFYYYVTMPVHVHIFTPDSILFLARSVGFVDIETATYSLWHTQAKADVLMRRSHDRAVSTVSFRLHNRWAGVMGRIRSLPVYVLSLLQGRGDCLIMTCVKPKGS
jgi:SAM-dependent methyltransferase